VKRTPWLSWRLFFLTFPIDVTVLWLSSDHADTVWNDYFEWFLLALIAHSSIAPFVAIALFFTSKVSSWKTELYALLVLGAVRGIAIHFGLGILDLESKVSSLYKVFNSTISLPLWFIGLALFVESRRQFQQEFEALFLRSMRKEQTSSGKQEISSAGMRDGQLIIQLQSLASGLAKEIEEALNNSTAKIDYAVQASKIQDLIKNKLRPASAELWNGATLSPPKLSVSELIKVSLLEQKLKVPAACLIFAPYIFIGLNGSHGWRFSAIETLIATILNALIFAIFEILFKNGLLTRKSTNILIIGSSYVIPLLAILYVISSFHVAILLCFNLYESLSNRRSAVLTNLERITQGKNVFSFSDSEHTAARDIDLARYLHGELQAGLIATSLLLETAVKSGDANLANHTLRSAVEILNQDHARVSELRKSSPRARLEKISSGWRGIAEVQIRLDWIDDLEGALLNDVIALIDESVSNAIRHAKASFILVAGSRTTTDLNFEILSDGSGMTFKSVGLGTKLFQELTSNWVYTKQGELNLLKFTVFTTVYE
jgi:signal transduction histidine kinase